MPQADIAIRKDEQTRRLFANDASIYHDLPEGVAFPRTTADIVTLVKKAAAEQFTITPRSAGTSLAGQTTGSGVVMDVSRHMDRILELNDDEQYAHVQPGVIRDTLNRHADTYNMEFGPDTATTNRCMLGGMIGNNSCGLFSVKHRTTREHVIEIEAVLSDGSTAVFKPLTNEELEQKKQLNNLEGHIYRSILQLVERHRDKILTAYPHPDIIRRNTGYALDRLCEMQPFNPEGRPFNLAELLCGSEGTLAITTAAKVRLVKKHAHRTVLAPHFETVNAAMEATVEAVKHNPAAVELVDDIILDATKHNIEQQKNRFFLEGDPKCILIIQLDDNNAQKLEERTQALKDILSQNGKAYTIPVIHDDTKINQAWELRKAGLGLLGGLGADEKSPSFCEDTAVRIQDLPAYVRDFQNLLNKYNTHCVFYGHASVGELHLRPVLDIQTEKGVQKLKDMSVDIAQLVAKYNGSLSGEHGDGRVRAPYIKTVLGEEMLPLLKKVKEIWDPNYRLNPGKIVDPKPIDEDLRIAASAEQPTADTHFKWRKEGGFSEAIDLCNGAGVCRKLAENGGTMCPSYMATKEEKDSTRGRANLFRQLFAGKGPDTFKSEDLHDALDLCISCKGCKSECPANVDMARMKAEFMQGWHENNGISASERFFGQAGKMYPLASLFPKLTNWFINTGLGKDLLHQLFNISPKRSLPTFAEQTFMQWHKKSAERTENNASSKPRVALLIDIFTNHHAPRIGKAAYHVLQSMGYHVIIPEVHRTGRPLFSKGMVEHAKNILDTNLPKFSAYAQQNIPIIGLEPSEILTLRDEYLDLCDDEQYKTADKVGKNSFTFVEFVSNNLSKQNEDLPASNGQKVYLHGHCHAKSLVGQGPLVEALTLAGHSPEVIQSGCCGMAGSFGYEADHYDVSMDIGNLVLFPSINKTKDDALICAPGFSCRHQITDGTERHAYHPAELLERILVNK